MPKTQPLEHELWEGTSFAIGPVLSKARKIRELARLFEAGDARARAIDRFASEIEDCTRTAISEQSALAREINYRHARAREDRT